MATIDEMRQVATQIENATIVGENTAQRVGGLFNDIVDELEEVGEFTTGEQVKDVGITSELDNSHNLIESAAVNAVLNDAMSVSEWENGSLDNDHEYGYRADRIIACSIINKGQLSYTLHSGYTMSIHEYSAEYSSVHDLSGGTWIKQSPSWIEGSGTYTTDVNTKTVVIILAKTPTTSGLAISPSDASNLSISYASAFTLAEMRTMLYEHDVVIDELEDEMYNTTTFSPLWYQGTLDNQHKYSSEGVAQYRIIATMPAYENIDIVVQSGYWCSVHEYSAEFPNAASINNGSSWLGNTHGWFNGSLKLIPLANSKTIVLVMAKGDKSQVVSPSDGVNMSITVNTSIREQTEINSEAIEEIDSILYGEAGGQITETITLEQGGMQSDGKKAPTMTDLRIRTADFVQTRGNFTINITNGIWYNIFYYSAASETSYVKTLSPGQWCTEVPFSDNWNGYIMLGFRNSGNTTIRPADTSVTITQSMYEEGLIEQVNRIDHADSDSYVWGADFLKRKVDVKYVGTLKYVQAFCMYNGNYYSVDGTNIAEQDSSFNTLRDVACNVGHGNSLQLVGNGKAWASGWDDQKMYKVDLSTLAVEQTITLPTTGYTTCAVDEDNGFMYIFQRQTNPSTEAQYNFIKYDYINQQILSTRKIETFAALQAVDYWQGKILMSFGFGTQAAPSGMRIYNTAGDVLASFDLEIFRSNEPEGIMFTRDTGEILVSDVDKKLYIIS